MGCSSSKSSQAGYKKPMHKVVTYGEHSEPSTTCSFLDQRSEPDGQEHDITNNADDDTKDLNQPRAYQKPRAEPWAEPPLSSTSQPSAKQQAAGKKETTNKKGPQPGHTVHDTRRPANSKACPSDRKHFMEPKPP